MIESFHVLIARRIHEEHPFIKTIIGFSKSHLRNSYIVCQTFVEHVYSNSMDLFICLTASVGQLKSNCKHALQPYLVLCLSPNNICIILIRLWENCHLKLSFELIAELQVILFCINHNTTQNLVFSTAIYLNLVGVGFSLGSGLLHRQTLIEGVNGN